MSYFGLGWVFQLADKLDLVDDVEAPALIVFDPEVVGVFLGLSAQGAAEQ